MKRAVTAALLGALFVLSFSAGAHVVPPEEYHPAAEGYRTLAFLVNLNPVPWDHVRKESDKIAGAYSELQPDTGAAYRARVSELIQAVETEARISSPTAALRIATARGVFEVSTRALSELIDLHLGAAETHLGDYDRAAALFDVSRQLWEAFAYEVRHTDPEAFRQIGNAWLEASSALGTPGILGVGAQPADSEVFGDAARRIRGYVNANFGEGYVAPESGRLIAVPTASETCNPAAAIPAKLPPGSNTNKQLPRPRQILNFAVRGGDEAETRLIALGDMLFDSPYILGEPARSLQISCNTCHNKGVTNPQFFIPGLSSTHGGMDVTNAFFKPAADNAVADPLDIPDLRGIRYTAPYGRNGRTDSLREFVRNVVVNEFSGPEPTPVMLDALVAYMNEFDFLPNPYLGPMGRLTDDAPEAARRGEKLFLKPFPQMNGMSCADCHRPSSHFTDGLTHDIGSVSRSSAYAADGAMNTPTLLSSAYTAPYFHDGSLPTLRSVVDWFNETFDLGLSEAEAADLTAYVETVGSGEAAYEDTIHTLEAELEEFSFFLSTYEFVRELDDAELLNTLFRTVETEINAHKWDVQDQRQLPVLNELEGLMRRAYAANLAGDSGEVDAIVAQYRETYAEHADVLK